MTPNSTPKYFDKPQQPIQSWCSCLGMKSQQNDNARLIFIFVVQLIYKGGDVMLHTVEQGMSSSAWSVNIDFSLFLQAASSTNIELKI